MRIQDPDYNQFGDITVLFSVTYRYCWILWTLLSVSDLSMEALFELVESETSHNVPNNSTTSLPFKETLLRLFETHILPTHNICHLQYLIFFVAGTGSFC